MTIVEYYEGLAHQLQPDDSDLVLIELPGARYCAFGDVARCANISARRRASLSDEERQAIFEQRMGRGHNTAICTNRSGFHCYLVCGQLGLHELMQDGIMPHVVPADPSMLPALDAVWRSIMDGHPKFKWFMYDEDPAVSGAYQMRLF